ncbi:hypothetical protein C8Q74DRAFT_1224839, partial [Fomes fomentarius]
AAWPVHKQMCRLRPQALNGLGYATPLALRQTLNEWIATHYWSLTTVVNAAVYRAGGWEFVLKNSRACVLQLQPEKHTDSGNPASAFRLMQTRITHKDSHDYLRDAWEDAMRDCRAMNEEIRRDGAVGPSFAGALLTALVIEGVVGLVPLSKFFLYRLSVRHVRDSYADEPTRAAFGDLIQVCANAIAGGYVIRKAEDRTKAEPEVGRLVQSRSKKSWRWERLPERCIRPIYDGAQRTTDLLPWELLTLFKIL